MALIGVAPATARRLALGVLDLAPLSLLSLAHQLQPLLLTLWNLRCDGADSRGMGTRAFLPRRLWSKRLRGVHALLDILAGHLEKVAHCEWAAAAQMQVGEPGRPGTGMDLILAFPRETHRRT